MSESNETSKLPNEIQEFYEVFDEAQRLEKPDSQIERLRTQELLARYLPPPPSVILDIGGGTGVYAFWLAERGYQIHLVDGIPRHIAQAEEAALQFSDHPLASIKLGDARHLEHPDNSADGILLLGPLYHLTERSDRILALREAHRTLRSGGILLAAGINRFASMVVALQEGLVDDAEFAPIYEQGLRYGQHRNPTGDPYFFTTAFFHYPQELIDEITEAGFRFEALLAIEGPVRIMKDFAEEWQKPGIQERLLKITRMVESEPTLWGISPHILAIGKKA
jgi:ubiquinone/menaquinone biosynthesis C-methylase UbiE